MINDLLMRFSTFASDFFEDADEIVQDLRRNFSKTRGWAHYVIVIVIVIVLEKRRVSKGCRSG